MRQREIGVRLAMGALRSQILSQFLKQGLGITLVGCIAGLLLSAGTSRLLAVCSTRFHPSIQKRTASSSSSSSSLPRWLRLFPRSAPLELNPWRSLVRSSVLRCVSNNDTGQSTHPGQLGPTRGFRSDRRQLGSDAVLELLPGWRSSASDLNGGERRHLQIPPTKRQRRRSATKRDICHGVMLSAIRSAGIGIRVGSEIRQIESAFPQKTCC